ncbi:MAG: hypothetical protein [Microvirus sp.]|nr:MAG: hypothetical protein [Microvirus sp.]
MMRWTTIYNHDWANAKRETNTKPSMTLPNQSMSMREIMSKFASGMPINASQREEIYDGEDFYPDPKTLDLAELQQIKEQYRDEIKEIESRQKKIKEDQKVLEKIPTEDHQSKEAKQGQPYENSDSTVESRPGRPPAAGGKTMSTDNKKQDNS